MQFCLGFCLEFCWGPGGTVLELCKDSVRILTRYCCNPICVKLCMRVLTRISPQKCSENASPNPPKRLPKPLKVGPGSLPRRGSGKSLQFCCQKPPKWCPRGSPKGALWAPFSSHFFCNFHEGSQNPPRHPAHGSWNRFGSSLAPFLELFGHLFQRPMEK